RVPRRRDRIAPVDAPDRDHVDRRRLLLEDVDLRGRGLRAQDAVAVEEKGVARRAGGVRRRERELVEVVLDRLDLAVVPNLVAEAEERVLDDPPHLGYGMKRPDRRRFARQGRVESLVTELLAELRVGEPPRRLALRFLQPGAELVQRPPRLGVANLSQRLR